MKSKLKNILLLFLISLVFFNIPQFSFAKVKLASWSAGYSSIPYARGHLTSQVYNDKIYVIGGMDESDNVTNRLDIYDTKTDTWSEGSPMITSRFSMTSELFEDKIYVIGGAVDYDVPVPNVEIYDIKTDTWVSGANMLPDCDYDYLSSVVYGGKIYCITTGNIQVYDIKSDSWSLLSTIPTARNAMECELYNGKIYCIGGFSFGNRVDTVEIYDIKTNTWSTGANMPTPKNIFASELYGGKIYTIGGYNAGSLDKVEIYDISSNTWSSGPTMLSGRSELETARVGNKIYAIAGLDISWNKTGIVEVLTLDDLSLEQSAIEAVEKAESTILLDDISKARSLVNSLRETNLKDNLQLRLNIISPNMSMSEKCVSSNLDIYIKSENMLSLSLDTNSIMFDGFSGVDDIEKLNAINLTVSSSLPYKINAYLSTEIQNGDKSKTMDRAILNIRANGESNYNTFVDIDSPTVLLDGQPADNNVSHGIDLMLKGNLAHEKDVYKTVIMFEAEQK